MNPSEPTCTKVQTLLMEASLALPSEVSNSDPNDEALLVHHLAECPTCKAYQSSLQHLTHSLKTLETIPVPADLADRIMQAIETPDIPQSTKNRSVVRWIPPMITVAATGLLLALAFPMLKTQEHPKQQSVASQPQILSQKSLIDTRIQPPALLSDNVDTSKIASAKPLEAELDELSLAAESHDDSLGNLVGF